MSLPGPPEGVETRPWPTSLQHWGTHQPCWGQNIGGPQPALDRQAISGAPTPGHGIPNNNLLDHPSEALCNTAQGGPSLLALGQVEGTAAGDVDLNGALVARWAPGVCGSYAVHGGVSHFSSGRRGEPDLKTAPPDLKPTGVWASLFVGWCCFLPQSAFQTIG